MDGRCFVPSIKRETWHKENTARNQRQDNVMIFSDHIAIEYRSVLVGGLVLKNRWLVLYKPWIFTTLGWDAVKNYDVADIGLWGSWKKMDPQLPGA